MNSPSTRAASHPDGDTTPAVDRPDADAGPSRKPIPDVQATADRRRIPIDRVGVTRVKVPLRLATRDNGDQHTVAEVNMYVSLPHDRKGTHMSRFLEVINDHGDRAIALSDIPSITSRMRERLDADRAFFEARFTYFIAKAAPVTGQLGLMDYEVGFFCCVDENDVDFILSVDAPATSLCPCSKEISAYGAHNQRCRIEAKVRMNGFMWIEDLVEILESAASFPVWSVLKRPDEKHVTERAYENPKFVEDIIRDLAVALNDDDRIRWYQISSENHESIHSHNAYAQITRDKRD